MKVGQITSQVAQSTSGSCTSVPGEHRTKPEQGPDQPDPNVSALSRSWTGQPPQCLFQPKLFCDSVNFSVLLLGQFLYTEVLEDLGCFSEADISNKESRFLNVVLQDYFLHLVCYCDAPSCNILCKLELFCFSTVFFSAGELNSGCLRQQRNMCLTQQV